MTEEYNKALKAGEKEYKARAAAGEYPYLPALDDLVPDADILSHQSLGIKEIPVEMIAGTKTRARQDSFAPDFMPLMAPDTEFAAKWNNLYKAQISEGFNDPVKVFEYLHRFYVQEGNKRVSVSRCLDMPTIAADVTRIMPPPEVLENEPAYREFLEFYRVAPIYEIETTWAGAYAEIAELLGHDLVEPWPGDLVRSLRSAYWMFSLAWRELGDKMPDLPPGDAFVVYLRIYIRDALKHLPPSVISKKLIRIKKELLIEANRERVALVESSDEAIKAGSLITKAGNLVAGPDSLIGKVLPAVTYSAKNTFKAAFIYDKRIEGSSRVADHEKGRSTLNEWIRTTKMLDGVIDFDAAVRDPNNPEAMQQAFLFENDWLHLNAKGYETMGGCIDLSLFTKTDPLADNEEEEPGYEDATWIEAEDMRTGTMGTAFKLVENTAASGSKYLETVTQTPDTPTSEAYQLSASFTAQKAGTYYVFARVLCPTWDDDSYFVSINGPLTSEFANGLQTNSWDWKELIHAALQPGEHKLTIGSREDGACIDKICITTNPVPPTGMGGTSKPTAIRKLSAKTVASVETYSLSGMRLAPHSSGPYIKVERADNGTVLSRKVILN